MGTRIIEVGESGFRTEETGREHLHPFANEDSLPADMAPTFSANYQCHATVPAFPKRIVCPCSGSTDTSYARCSNIATSSADGPIAANDMDACVRSLG